GSAARRGGGCHEVPRQPRGYQPTPPETGPAALRGHRSRTDRHACSAAQDVRGRWCGPSPTPEPGRSTRLRLGLLGVLWDLSPAPRGSPATGAAGPTSRPAPAPARDEARSPRPGSRPTPASQAPCRPVARPADPTDAPRHGRVAVRPRTLLRGAGE